MPRSFLLPLAPDRFAAILVALSAMLVLALPGLARAETQQPGPVRIVMVTAGLNWTDVSAERTPTLQCLADHAGLGAMSATSATERSTLRQGTETIRTGWPGLAAEAPSTSGIPDPPVDLLEQLPGGVSEVDATGADADPVAAARALADGGEDTLVMVHAGAVPAEGTAGREDAVQQLDARVGAVLDAVATSEGAATDDGAAPDEDGDATGQACAEGSLPRTLLLSAAYFPNDGGVTTADPSASAPSPQEVETGAVDVPGRTMLQVAMDTGYPGMALTSGSTHQNGVVALTDAAPTILNSHGLSVPSTAPGQPMYGVEHNDPQLLATDRTLAGDLLRVAEVPALLTWMGVTGIGAVILLIPPLARRPRLATVGRALAVCAPLVLPVGLAASVVPWWRSDHPILALTAVLWAGALPLAALVLAGPWRHSRFGRAGASAALVVGGILLESATGSRLQLGSPMGAQAVIGGRYYGISNHLFGIVLGATAIAVLCLFAYVRSRRARLVWTVIIGAIVTVACVAPTIGADFGSMLALVPMFGLIALWVADVRLRWWHLLGLGVGAMAAVLAVSFADWLRPPEQRTHLGRFIENLLSGNLLDVVVRRLALNWDMLTGVPGLGVLVLFAAALSVLVMMPRRVGLQRLSRLDVQFPAARAVRVAFVLAAWIGFFANDTGPVLIAGALGMWLAYLPTLLPAGVGIGSTRHDGVATPP